MCVEKIVLAGNGHGVISAYRSLAKIFPEIHALTTDAALIQMLRMRDRVIADFGESDARYAVCAGYKELIEKSIICSKVMINTHPSLLPKYRGMHSVVWAMLNGESEFGFTVHLMNEFMDDGDILHQYRILNIGQTSKEVMDDFDEFVQEKLGSIIENYISGMIKPIPQDRSLATWVPRRNLNDCFIQYDMPNWRLRALLRALVPPYPLPRLEVGGCVYEVEEAEVVDSEYYCTIGQVVNMENQVAYVKTKDGVLLVKRILNARTKMQVSIGDVFRIGQRL